MDKTTKVRQDSVVQENDCNEESSINLIFSEEINSENPSEPVSLDDLNSIKIMNDSLLGKNMRTERNVQASSDRF